MILSSIKVLSLSLLAFGISSSLYSMESESSEIRQARERLGASLRTTQTQYYRGLAAQAGIADATPEEAEEIGRVIAQSKKEEKQTQMSREQAERQEKQAQQYRDRAAQAGITGISAEQAETIGRRLIENDRKEKTAEFSRSMLQRARK